MSPILQAVPSGARPCDHCPVRRFFCAGFAAGCAFAAGLFLFLRWLAYAP